MKRALGSLFCIYRKRSRFDSVLRVFGRNILWLLFAFLSLYSFCPHPIPPYERNPNLRLLLSKEGCSLFNPAWIPKGEKIYYLCADEYFPRQRGIKTIGELRVVSQGSLEDKLLMEGKFREFSIPPDGSKLALTNVSKTSIIILADSAGKIIDTVRTSQSLIGNIRFSADGTKLYYASYGEEHPGYYRINIDGTEEELILATPYPKSFDLTSTDSLITIEDIGDSTEFFRVDPTDDNYIAYVKEWAYPNELDTFYLCILNRETRETIYLRASPYKFSGIFYPHWSASGKEIVFSAQKHTEGGSSPIRFQEVELWVLENIEVNEKGKP